MSQNVESPLRWRVDVPDREIVRACVEDLQWVEDCVLHTPMTRMRLDHLRALRCEGEGQAPNELVALARGELARYRRMVEGPQIDGSVS